MAYHIAQHVPGHREVRFRHLAPVDRHLAVGAAVKVTPDTLDSIRDVTGVREIPGALEKDVFDEMGVRFGLEVHPTEIAFDIASAERALQAIGNRKTFGFNYDPSHFGYQGVDYVKFIHQFSDRIYHVHMKDVWWSNEGTEAGVFGGHTDFGDIRRQWDFRSLGRGNIDFEEIIRALNRSGYTGPLSVEWEDIGMDREHGAEEACDFVRAVDFPPSSRAFDAAFSE